MKLLRIPLTFTLILAPQLLFSWVEEEGRAAERELARIAQLQGDSQREALRTFLTVAEFKLELLDVVAENEHRFHAPLVWLLKMPETEKYAATVLTYIGYREGIDAVLSKRPMPIEEDGTAKDQADVLCELLDPRTDREWAYLRAGARREFGGSGEDCAIQSLKLIASTKALSILEEAQELYTEQERGIRVAIQHVRSSPQPMQGTDLAKLVERTGEAIMMGERTGDPETRLSKSGRVALVKFHFYAGCNYTFAAAFHRQDRVWQLRGVRITTISKPPPPPPSYPR